MIKNILKNIILKIKEKRLPKATGEELKLISDLREKIGKLPEIDISREKSEAKINWLKNLITLRKYLYSRDPRMFLGWDVIVHTMFYGGKSCEFEYLKKLSDWNKWQEAIKESAVGQPQPYYLQENSSSNLIHLAYSAARAINKLGIDTKKIKTIFEFGGGYGGMCRLFYRLGFSGEYTIFDLPEFSFLQEYYLKSINLETNFQINTNETRKNNSINLINDLKKIKNVTEKQGVDLFIATWSLSESPTELRENILNLVNKPNFYLIAYQKKFEDVDNFIYFKNLCKKNKNYQWENIEIEHLPGNYYLFGKKK